MLLRLTAIAQLGAALSKGGFDQVLCQVQLTDAGFTLQVLQPLDSAARNLPLGLVTSILVLE